jgi:hypothetical protein
MTYWTSGVDCLWLLVLIWEISGFVYRTWGPLSSTKFFLLSPRPSRKILWQKTDQANSFCLLPNPSFTDTSQVTRDASDVEINLWDDADWGIRFLWNVSNTLPDYTASHHRRVLLKLIWLIFKKLGRGGEGRLGLKHDVSALSVSLRSLDELLCCRLQQPV